MLTRNYKKVLKDFQNFIFKLFSVLFRNIFRFSAFSLFGLVPVLGLELAPLLVSKLVLMLDMRHFFFAEFKTGSHAGFRASSGDGSYVGSFAGFKTCNCTNSLARIEAGTYAGSLAGFEPGSCAVSRSGIGAISRADSHACFRAGSNAGTDSRTDFKK